MKFFVTGVGGQLGYDVVNELKRRNHECIGSDILPKDSDADYIQLDITDEAAVFDVIAKIKPDAVIHCAAWTAVDAAEDEENKKKVYAINVEGTQNIANVCKELDCKMLYISTDYVFDGKGELPWTADCKEYSPQNFYGKTKLEGENAVSSLLEKYFIVRIAWVFGKNGNNFIKTMLNLFLVASGLRPNRHAHLYQAPCKIACRYVRNRKIRLLPRDERGRLYKLVRFRLRNIQAGKNRYAGNPRNNGGIRVI